MQSARAEAVAAEVKMGVEGLDLYYGEFHALKTSRSIFRRTR